MFGTMVHTGCTLVKCVGEGLMVKIQGQKEKGFFFAKSESKMEK